MCMGVRSTAPAPSIHSRSLSRPSRKMQGCRLTRASAVISGDRGLRISGLGDVSLEHVRLIDQTQGPDVGRRRDGLVLSDARRGHDGSFADDDEEESTLRVGDKVRFVSTRPPKTVWGGHDAVWDSDDDALMGRLATKSIEFDSDGWFRVDIDPLQGWFVPRWVEPAGSPNGLPRRIAD